MTLQIAFELNGTVPPASAAHDPSNTTPGPSPRRVDIPPFMLPPQPVAEPWQGRATVDARSKPFQFVLDSDSFGSKGHPQSSISLMVEKTGFEAPSTDDRWCTAMRTSMPGGAHRGNRVQKVQKKVGPWQKKG